MSIPRIGGGSGGDFTLKRFPLVGQQFGKPGLRKAADAFEDIAQVGEGIDT